MVSHRLVFALLLVGFACLCSGADIRKMLEEILGEEDTPKDTPKRLPPGLPRPPLPPPNMCFMDGKAYKVGQRWVDKKCTGLCKCRRYGIACVSLCPPSWAKCRPGEVESTEQRPAGDKEGRCFCRVPICVKKGEIESMTVKK